MGVTDDTVRKWIETNNPPRHARAYVQLALVLKAAQKFVPSPVSPKAEKPVTLIAPVYGQAVNQHRSGTPLATPITS
jgi:hypothetical protein